MNKLYMMGSYLIPSNNRSFVLLRDIKEINISKNESNHWIKTESVKHLIKANPQIIVNFTGVFATPEEAKQFMNLIQQTTWCPKDIHIVGLVF